MPPFWVGVVLLGTPANVFLKCCLRGISGVGGRFSLVSLVLLHILYKHLCPYSPQRPSYFGHVLFFSFITEANQKLAGLQ